MVWVMLDAEMEDQEDDESEEDENEETSEDWDSPFARAILKANPAESCATAVISKSTQTRKPETSPSSLNKPRKERAECDMKDKSPSSLRPVNFSQIVDTNAPDESLRKSFPLFLGARKRRMVIKMQAG